MKKEIAIFWFRRDLRLEDNKGLFYALQSGYKVLPLFIFDEDILSKLENRKDRRVDFIHQAIENLNASLKQIGSQLYVKYGMPLHIWKEIIDEYKVKEVYFNHDYEKYGMKRDESISALCDGNGIAFKSFKDQCIFEKNEIVSISGTPYTVFTPYSKKWKETLNNTHFKSFKSENYLNNFFRNDSSEMISLEEMALFIVEYFSSMCAYIISFSSTPLRLNIFKKTSVYALLTPFKEKSIEPTRELGYTH